VRVFLPALAVSAVVVAMALYASEVRVWLERVLDAGYVRAMGAGFAVAVAAVLVWVVARIREDRVRRYGLLVLGLALLLGQVMGWSRADAAVNAVERVHFLYYGLLGVLWFRAFRRRRGDLSAIVSSVLAILLVGIADEGLQWWAAARTGELYDVVLNVYAGVTGLLVALALDGPRSLDWGMNAASWRTPARLAGASVIALAAFLHLAHLGYRIVDPEIGAFYSYFTVEGLEAASRDRARRWSEEPLGPPGVYAPLEREDWFRSEAGMHVQHRNASLERDDVYQVWKENRILERYYAPFLEQRGRDGNPFRLPAETLAAVEQAVPRRDPYPYSSPVGRNPRRIWARPSKTELWAFASVTAVALVVVAQVAGTRRR
jgi:hypothetical protein